MTNARIDVLRAYSTRFPLYRAALSSNTFLSRSCDLSYVKPKLSRIIVLTRFPRSRNSLATREIFRAVHHLSPDLRPVPLKAHTRDESVYHKYLSFLLRDFGARRVNIRKIDTITSLGSNLRITERSSASRSESSRIAMYL